MLRLHVRIAQRTGGEALDRDELVRVLDALVAGEVRVALLLAHRLGVALDPLQPLVPPLRADRHLHDDEDHGAVPPLRRRLMAGMMARRWRARPSVPHAEGEADCLPLR